ncbi:MAG: M6 family metalloprotease domain-containing protein, partial [Muribaculaceae bacterium]|nr:M6 family metalloprotease domain-containing protein [Muribaculaceae bacterium]
MRLQTLIISATVTLTASAVPAMRGLRPVVQPDGSPVMIERVGSARAHATLDSDGHLLTLADGYYVPARIDEFGRTVRAESLTRFTDADADRMASATATPRRSRRALPNAVGKFPGSTFPGFGSPKALVILVQYSDVKFTLGNKAASYFNAMLSEPGFSDPTYGGTGSCLDYFTEASMGQFTPDFDVYGPVTLKNSRAYYGGNDMYGNDRNAHLMAIDACTELDAEVDFSQYDTDGDGYIDNVFIFYAGQGEASYGPDDSVWPHAWTIYDALEGGPCPEFDGVLLNSYGCSNEWESNRPDGIGTFCHEFSHVIGLPDLYSTTTELTCTPGIWSVLDYGPYNNNGRTPPTYSTFERNAMGWIDLIEITDETETVTIPDLRTSN